MNALINQVNTLTGSCINGIPLSQLFVTAYDTRGKIHTINLEQLMNVFNAGENVAANTNFVGNENFVLNANNAGESLTLNNANLTIPTTVNIGPGVVSGNSWSLNVQTNGQPIVFVNRTGLPVVFNGVTYPNGATIDGLSFPFGGNYQYNLTLNNNGGFFTISGSVNQVVV